jgi:hypothetical protein
MKEKSAVIVGAGLSGLAAAVTLSRAGIRTVLIEANSKVGGRVCTDSHPDGFLLDRGFQVLLSSYPEISCFVDPRRLDLRTFDSGARVFNGTGFDLLANPLVHPSLVFSTLKSPIVSIKDALLVLKLLAQSSIVKTDADLGGSTTALFLQNFGFSTLFVENFWRPFLQGVFLDPALGNGDQFFKFLIRCFASGRVTIPNSGMQRLPTLMAEELRPGSILFNSKVEEIDRGRVQLASGQSIAADVVIWAASPRHSVTSWKCVTTHYFTGSSLALGRWLNLVPKSFGLSVDHFCDLGAVSDGYGGGRSLLSVSQVGRGFNGSQSNINAVHHELEHMSRQKLQLHHLKTTVVEEALPKSLGLTEGYIEKDGVFYCGDYCTSPSINGALRSGRLAAAAALANLK